MRIAVDIEGGDHSPVPQARGAIEALDMAPDLELTLVGFQGHQQVIENVLRRARGDIRDRLSVHYARDIVPMQPTGGTFVRDLIRKKSTTMHAAVAFVAEKKASAVVTSGNTTGLTAIAATFLRRFRGAMPALMVRIPSEKGHDVVLLDVGANPNTTPEQLATNARWGAICAERLCGQREPLVRLLSNGVEEGKGDATRKGTQDILAGRSDVRFRGNVEPHHLLVGEVHDPHADGPEDVHVVATDGFSGNIALKMLEAAASTFVRRARERANRGSLFSPGRWMRMLGGLALRGVFRDVRSEFKAKVGSAMVLGLDGLAFKIHGGAKANDVRDGILGARQLASTDILEEFRTLHGNGKKD